MKKSRALAFCILLLPYMLLPFNSNVSAQEAVQFSPLQEIINNAEDGATIYVRQGTYYGVTKVNKSLNLIGADVILDANGWQVGLIISAPNVLIEGFTILNASRYEKGYPPQELSELWISPEMVGSGIYVYFARNVTISNMTITQCYAGIGFTYSERPNYVINSTVSHIFWGMLFYYSYVDIFNSVIRDNTFTYNFPDGNIAETGGGGISLHHYAQMNMTYTTILNNNVAISISYLVEYSYINFNNFINNTRNIDIHPGLQREAANWTGNFWSDYKGEDVNLDGLGDTPYVIDRYNQDLYPLMKDPSLHQSTQHYEKHYRISIACLKALIRERLIRAELANIYG